MWDLWPSCSWRHYKMFMTQQVQFPAKKCKFTWWIAAEAFKPVVATKNVKKIYLVSFIYKKKWIWKKNSVKFPALEIKKCARDPLITSHQLYWCSSSHTKHRRFKTTKFRIFGANPCYIHVTTSYNLEILSFTTSNHDVQSIAVSWAVFSELPTAKIIKMPDTDHSRYSMSHYCYMASHSRMWT